MNHQGKRNIYVDGYQRTGSTFLCSIFRESYGSSGSVFVNSHATHQLVVYKLLRTLSPESPLVISLRDPRDVLVSRALHNFYTNRVSETLNVRNYIHELFNEYEFLSENKDVFIAPFEVYSKSSSKLFDVFDAKYPEFAEVRVPIDDSKVLAKISSGDNKTVDEYWAMASAPRDGSNPKYEEAKSLLKFSLSDTTSMLGREVSDLVQRYERLKQRYYESASK